MSGVLEHGFARLIVDLCVVGVVLGSLYHLTAVILVLRFARARKVPRAPFPAVTILRPLHGNEPGLFARIASLCRQDYPGPVDVICGVQQENDTAIPVVRLLQDTGRPEIQLNIDELRAWIEPPDLKSHQHATGSERGRGGDLGQRHRR